MGKESIPTQFFNAIITPSRKDLDLKTSPKSRLSTKENSILKCLWMCPSSPPCWKEINLTNDSMNSPVPAGFPSLAKLKSNPVPEMGPLAQQ